MSNMFGTLFISKEERQKKFEEYSKRIFPYGNDQRVKVSELLSEMFPKEKERYLIMHYILVKEQIISKDLADFDTIYKKIAKKKIVRNSEELKSAIYTILKFDMKIDDNLNYPTLAELKNMIEG